MLPGEVASEPGFDLEEIWASRRGEGMLGRGVSGRGGKTSTACSQGGREQFLEMQAAEVKGEG